MLEQEGVLVEDNRVQEFDKGSSGTLRKGWGRFRAVLNGGGVPAFSQPNWQTKLKK